MQTVHDTEVRFYEDIAPQIQLALPEVYASQKCASFKTISQGYLLMEDVSGRAGMASIGEGLTKGQVNINRRSITSLYGSPKFVVSFNFCERPRSQTECGHSHRSNFNFYSAPILAVFGPVLGQLYYGQPLRGATTLAREAKMNLFSVRQSNSFDA